MPKHPPHCSWCCLDIKDQEPVTLMSLIYHRACFEQYDAWFKRNASKKKFTNTLINRKPWRRHGNPDS